MPNFDAERLPEHSSVGLFENRRILILGRVQGWVTYLRAHPGIKQDLGEWFQRISWEASRAESAVQLDDIESRFARFEIANAKFTRRIFKD
jgi:hypothetical protein